MAADEPTPLRSGHSEPRKTEDLAAELDQWLDALDLGQLSRKIEDFGRENPVGLAVGALVVGFAAGLVLRRQLSGGG